MAEGTRTGTKMEDTERYSYDHQAKSSQGHSLVGFNRISWATHPYSSTIRLGSVSLGSQSVGISQGRLSNGFSAVAVAKPMGSGMPDTVKRPSTPSDIALWPEKM